ncbi:MAG: hypothetical protein WCC90_08555, partial [Methylocella sp.]
PQKIIGGNDVALIQAEQKFLYFYGYFKYRDVFSESADNYRETHFCYRLHLIPLKNQSAMAAWIFAGPEGSNRYT